MAFREAGMIRAFDIKKPEYKGKKPTGYYTGKQTISTKLGDQVIYSFLSKDGKEFGIFGFANLNMKMAQVPVGALTQLEYMGTENLKTKYGMKDVHQVKVLFDSTDTINGPEEQHSAPTPEEEEPLPF